VERKAEPVADNERRPLESFVDCVTTGPSDAPAGGNICMEGQCAGNGPINAHMYQLVYKYPFYTTTTHTTVLRPFFRDHPGEPVPEENFWTLWCKGRSTEADTPTIRLGPTPSRLTSALLHHPPQFFTGRMPFLPPNQQCQSTEGNLSIVH